IPEKSQARVADTSKADALPKLTMVLQTSWFVLRVVARLVQNCPRPNPKCPPSPLPG
ncbi:uncharacterized protein LAESUDRAFT_640738, partial [Laetiporus sulphureus 93-53]